MVHLKLYEEFCEGDMEDMIALVRHIDPESKILHYGFDYIEMRLENRTEEIADEIIKKLLKKFEREIAEIYSEETGWFKIYLKP